jgi:hypothetical protein
MSEVTTDDYIKMLFAQAENMLSDFLNNREHTDHNRESSEDWEHCWYPLTIASIQYYDEKANAEKTAEVVHDLLRRVLHGPVPDIGFAKFTDSLSE